MTTSHKSSSFAALVTAATLTGSLFAQNVIAQMPTIAVSQRQAQSQTVIKFKLQDNPGSAEWIRLEMTGKTTKLLHTRHAISGFSQVLGPPLLPRFYTWYDHPVSQVTFAADRCSQQLCTIHEMGNTVTLPDSVDIYQGRFTVEYTESGILRTATFRVPEKL